MTTISSKKKQKPPYYEAHKKVSPTYGDLSLKMYHPQELMCHKNALIDKHHAPTATIIIKKTAKSR